MREAWLNTKQSGASVVEVLLASTVLGMLSLAVIGALIYGRASTAESGNRERATLLAEEGVEAARNIRDANYTNLVDGTYGLAQTSNQWAFSGSSDSDGFFTRQVTVASNGTSRKTVTSNVSWNRGARGTGSVSVSTQFTNWLATIVRSWANPAVESSLDLTNTNNGLKVATAGNYAYVVRTDGTPDFVVVDISNPAAPTVVGSLSLTGSLTNVAVSGNYAYVSSTNDTGELYTINIAAPTAPVLTSTFNASGTADANGVFISGNYAYLTRNANNSNDEFVIVNITTPGNPLRAGGYSLNVNMYESFVNATTIYIATSSDTQEVLVINASILGLLTLGTSVNLPGTADALTIAGNNNGQTLLVGQGSTLYTLTTPILLAPTVQGSITTSGIVNDITVDTARNYAFVGTSGASNQFQVFNVATPTSISLFGAVSSPSNSIISGVAYSTTKDRIVGVGPLDAQEVVIYAPGQQP